jgi:excisionase family DNA binding protein
MNTKQTHRGGLHKGREAHIKSRPTQFGARESTASSRQYASRLAVSRPSSQSGAWSVSERDDKQSSGSATPTIDRFNLSLTELESGGIGRKEETIDNPASESHAQAERSEIERPLTCEEAADLVRAHPRTVKRMARRGDLPGHFRFGRWLFYASELDGWMRGELHSTHRPCR